jgi:hypothetical protein
LEDEMKTRTKIWLGVGAFAFAQVAGVSLNGGLPSVGIGQPAQAADGTCGWERSNQGGWHYDGNCEKGERYTDNRSRGERGERWDNNRWERGQNYQHGQPWNERGERWNARDNRWERGNQWNHGERGERWGERG